MSVEMNPGNRGENSSMNPGIHLHHFVMVPLFSNRQRVICMLETAIIAPLVSDLYAEFEK